MLELSAQKRTEKCVYDPEEDIRFIHTIDLCLAECEKFITEDQLIIERLCPASEPPPGAPPDESGPEPELEDGIGDVIANIKLSSDAFDDESEKSLQSWTRELLAFDDLYSAFSEEDQFFFCAQTSSAGRITSENFPLHGNTSLPEFQCCGVAAEGDGPSLKSKARQEGLVSEKGATSNVTYLACGGEGSRVGDKLLEKETAEL